MAVLWFKGNIYTMIREGEKVEAVVTEKGRIIGAGPLEEIMRRFQPVIDERVDLQGYTMIPGFVDSHMHLVGYGESLFRLDLSSMKSKGEILNALKERVENLQEGEWLIGEGWNENLWTPPSSITRGDLDVISPIHPIVLKRVCRHMSVANSKALQIAGITPETENPEGGVIEKVHGELTGVLKDRAQDLLTGHMPEYTVDYLKTLVRKAVKNAYSFGLTGAHTEDLNYYGSFSNTFRAIKEVIEGEGLPFRAHLLVHHGVIDEWKGEGHRYLSGGPFVEFGAMKIFADGSLGARTALLSCPYGDDPSTNGVAVQSYEELQQLVQKARNMEIPVAVHAIGDLAFEWVLDALEKYPLLTMGRDRIIHAQLLRADLIRRLKGKPIILDIQPRFLASDFPWVFERIGDGPIDYLYPWKTLIREGIRCAGGSDAPIEPISPLMGIHSAVTRTIPGKGEKVYQPEERLSVYEAVSLFTKGSAYAAMQEQSRGEIRPGFVADFTVLDRDLFEIEADDIPLVHVQMTVVDGKIMYKKA